MAFRKAKVLRSYILNVLLVLLIIAMPAFFMGVLITNDGDEAIGLVFFNAVFQLFITLPFTWLVYKNHIRGKEELSFLQTALGNSNANLDFLRSQINPHFLFNALNTIYGTALQEKAERTSEGIEKLGDMMRFMLQENMQDKISLEREINYMSNYISLHKLRTDTNPVVRIEEQLPSYVNGMEIAPMLLIPFVENAFKHGISLREPSYIKVSMETRENNLYFDVYNNKHQKQGEDPEKNKSGIGLNNVKLRLQLLYPGKHELVIRETATDYFVHLTLNLS
jgi:LytS/YehU family sensor histidine kinase